MSKKLQTIWKYSKWAYSFYYDSLKDLYLRVWTWLKRENSIGRYVEIASKIERDMHCSNSSAGGICYKVMIKLFLFKEYFSGDDAIEEITCMILEHEILHQVLRNRIGLKAYQQLDNIHMPFFVNDQWMLGWRDPKENKLIS